jgi:hypothetical protein
MAKARPNIDLNNKNISSQNPPLYLPRNTAQLHSQHGKVSLQLGLVAQRGQLRIIIAVVASHLLATISINDVFVYIGIVQKKGRKGRAKCSSTCDTSKRCNGDVALLVLADRGNNL